MSEQVGKIIEGEFQLVDAETGKPTRAVTLPAAPSPRQLTAQAKAELAFATTRLLAGEIDHVREWLKETAARNPAEAIRLWMELTEFVTPRLKAANVNLNANTTDSGAPRQLSDMSLDELNGLLGP